MKKIILTVCSAALFVAASCSKNETAANIPTEDKLLGDSVAAALGQMAGARENMNLKRIMDRMTDQEKANFKKDEFLRGLELVLTTDTTNLAFLNGLYTGLNLYNPVIGAEKETGIPINAKTVIKAFREAYMTDSISDLQQYQEDYQRLSKRLMEKAEKRRQEEIANTPEAKENKAKGEEYQNKMLGEGFQKTESGLIYKINNPGTGDKVKATDRIKLTYVGKHINGESFDESKEGGYESIASAFVPGFAEGLQLLGKGGSATLVIPADLAYGLEGARDVIGPNETLVFEITVEDITTKK